MAESLFSKEKKWCLCMQTADTMNKCKKELRIYSNELKHLFKSVTLSVSKHDEDSPATNQLNDLHIVQRHQRQTKTHFI